MAAPAAMGPHRDVKKARKDATFSSFVYRACVLRHYHKTYLWQLQQVQMAALRAARRRGMGRRSSALEEVRGARDVSPDHRRVVRPPFDGVIEGGQRCFRPSAATHGSEEEAIGQVGVLGQDRPM